MNEILDLLPKTGDGWFNLVLGVVILIILWKLFHRPSSNSGGKK